MQQLRVRTALRTQVLFPGPTWWLTAAVFTVPGKHNTQTIKTTKHHQAWRYHVLLARHLNS